MSLLRKFVALFAPKASSVTRFIPPAFDEERHKHLTRHISQAEHRHERKVSRWINKFRFRRDFMRSGGPVLTGARLARVQDQCSPRHLTVLSRYHKKQWEAHFVA